MLPTLLRTGLFFVAVTHLATTQSISNFTLKLSVSSNATSHMAKKSIRPELMQLKTPPSDGCLSVNVVSGALIGARLPGY